MNKCFAAVAVLVTAFNLAVSGPSPEIHLTGIPDSTPHCYKMTTNVTHIEPNGQRKTWEVYTVWLELTPKAEGDRVTCRRFTFREGEAPEVAIPSLQDWSYRLPKTAFDDRGQLFGIEQAKFERLLDEKGKVIPQGDAYMVFNAFVDFHSFCHVFAARTNSGMGIQDLHQIGDKIVHAAANGEAPVSMGSMVEKGSTFKNGEITLELKGSSTIKGESCAIVGYDSGNSSLHMILKPMPQMKVETYGGSHYWGDIFINLNTQWVQKATLAELVVSETAVPGMPTKLHSVIERWIVLESISSDQCAAELK